MPILKRGIRILAIDDSFRRGEKRVLIIGLIGRQGLIEGALSSIATVDGTDSTRSIKAMISGSRFSTQIALIATNGITVGGLNLIDLCELSEELKVPVIGITRRRPRVTALLTAMRRLEDYRDRAKTIAKIRKRIRVAKVSGYYVQSIGINSKEAERFVPDAADLLRTTHIIASGIMHGESKGRV